MIKGLNLTDFKLDDEILRFVRNELYHSTKPGYILLPNFINKEHVNHLRNIWQKVPDGYHKHFQGKNKIYFGCPNYVNKYEGALEQVLYYNFLWNVPYDELSYNMALHVQIIRNMIEGRNFTNHIFPFSGESASYRVTITKQGENVVKPHRDHYMPHNKTSKLHDISRLQATLYLSKNGVDYTGTGFKFRTNAGKDIEFDVDFPVETGTLVIWRHQNLHSVETIKTTGNQLGFCRILFPSEPVHPKPIKGVYSENLTLGLKKILPRPVKQILKQALGINS